MTPPSKPAKRSRIALSAPRVLNSTSPVLNQDIHGFLTTVLSPMQWPQYSDEEKVKIINLLPAAYRNYNLDPAGSLVCPVNLEFLENDGYVKAGVARFKRDLEAGVWEGKWQRDAHKARQERKEGKFDQYLKDRAEEQFGDDNSHDGDKEGDGDDPDSGSDWARDNGKREAVENHMVETLLRQSDDSSKIEVKWKGYEKTTWEPRATLQQDVPFMVTALTSSQRKRSLGSLSGEQASNVPGGSTLELTVHVERRESKVEDMADAIMKHS